MLSSTVQALKIGDQFLNILSRPHSSGDVHTAALVCEVTAKTAWNIDWTLVRILHSDAPALIAHSGGMSATEDQHNIYPLTHRAAAEPVPLVPTCAAPPWLLAFGPVYDCPPCPEWLVDLSESNDTCPSYGQLDANGEPILRLWIDHPEPKLREYFNEGAPRYMVIGEDGQPYYEGDNWDSALASAAEVIHG